MKEQINYGDPTTQQRLDVARGIDDSARLPVVAYEREWSSAGVEPYKEKNANGRMALPFKFKLLELSKVKLRNDDVELCRLTDAQARLAEKDARIAQLAAHARGKNKALANALKEIARLKRTIETGLDNELALVGERTELRAQLAQLQAAPAERGVDSMLRKKAPQPPTLARCGTGALYGEQTYCFEKGWRQGIAAYRKMLRRLNPAPATADSDVREVSE